MSGTRLKFKKLRHVTEDIFYNVLRIKVELNKKNRLSEKYKINRNSSAFITENSCWLKFVWEVGKSKIENWETE